MLLVHAVSSLVALALGALVLVADKRWRFHGRLGSLYHWTMVVVAISALAISVSRGRATVFTYVTPPSYALALLGYTSGKLRWRGGWLAWHITGQSGSYVALLTGLAFQTVPRLLPPEVLAAHRTLVLCVVFVTPALLAQPLIIRAQQRWTARRRKSTATWSPALAGR